MTEEAYAQAVLANYSSTSNLLVAQTIITRLSPSIYTWANGHLFGIYPAGSIAKGTAILGSSDVDVLISVKSTAVETLQQVYEKLFNRLTLDGFSPRRQNVSLGVTIDGRKVDVVPAKKQNLLTNNHSLWSHKQKTRRETNIHDHINYVINSGRQADIRLVKIWKELHSLEFPSFPLEVTVINALTGTGTSLSQNFVQVMEYLRDHISTVRIIDPTKPSNVLSDELTITEKIALANAATSTLAGRWNEAVW